MAKSLSTPTSFCEIHGQSAYFTTTMRIRFCIIYSIYNISLNIIFLQSTINIHFLFMYHVLFIQLINVFTQFYVNMPKVHSCSNDLQSNRRQYSQYTSKTKMKLFIGGQKRHLLKSIKLS